MVQAGRQPVWLWPGQSGPSPHATYPHRRQYRVQVLQQPEQRQWHLQDGVLPHRQTRDASMAAESAAPAAPARTRTSSSAGWLYNRIWWDHDTFAITLGGGQMSNPGRYLTLLPPIDGAGPRPVRLTSRKFPARRLTCGTARLRSSTCRDSTSPGGRRWDIVTPTSRTSRAAAESRLRAATTACRSTIPASVGRLSDDERPAPRQHGLRRRPAASGSRTFAGAKPRLSVGVMVKF